MSCAACEKSAHNLSNLMKLIGNPGVCGNENRKGCGQPIWWITTKTRTPAPLNPDGTPHFATCPNALEFKRKQGMKRTGA